MNKPIGAPACFAAASIFSQDSDICKGCMAFAECSSASLETLEAIRNVINVDDLLKRHAAARKVAQAARAEADQKKEDAEPPGNVDHPTIVKPVQRKTPVVNIKFEASADEDQIIGRMPVKAREVALRMVRSNDVDGVRKALSEGRNHYAEGGPAFLRVAMGMLITGGFTKRTLRDKLETELKWTEASAASHVGMVCAIVLGFKFVKEIKGHFAWVPGSVE